jgi:hypothetical protein
MRNQSPFACVMDAIEPRKREPHIANARALFNRILEIIELDDGYAFRFSNEEDVLSQLTDFIVLERLCCPFFGFAVEVEPEGGAVWFRLTGRDGVKPFIKAELGEFLKFEIVGRR